MLSYSAVTISLESSLPAYETVEYRIAMTSKTSDDDQGSIDDGQAVSAVFKLLSHHRRRVAIRYLATQVGATSITDLADQIALVEGEHTADNYARICVSLVHNHLPIMSDAEVIDYDLSQETVELRSKATNVLSHLDLAADADIAGESL